MDTKDIAILAGLTITVGGVLWQLARSITQGATIQDVYNLERKLEAKIDARDTKSTETHGNFVTRLELTAVRDSIDKRLDKFEDKFDTRMDAVGETLSRISITLSNKGGSRG